MIRPLATFAAVVTAGVALAGCGVLSRDADPAPPAAAPQPTTAQQPTADPSGSRGASVKDAGDLPDVCALLSSPEVTGLTGKPVTQVDPDGAQPGDASRFCQWQLSDGQLAVFLSRSTKAEFDVKNESADPVAGLGEDAYQLSGHLYVLYGTAVVDVYARGGSDEQNLTIAKMTVTMLLPRI